MTLRARLVTALGAFVTVGLVAFGFATYVRYSRVEYQRLDDQLRAALPGVSRQLTDAVGIDSRGGGGGNGGGRRGEDDHSPAISVDYVSVLRVVYAELRSPSGALVARLTSDGTPNLPTGVARLNHTFTVGSTTGSAKWRVATAAASSPNATGYQVLIATPTKPVTDSLSELLLIETVAGLIILLVLVGGSWVIVRRGLRPLEAMGATARSINAGDLSQRVSPADGKGEVGQLGLALNSMLDELEDAFHTRDETERRLRQFLADASHELRTPLTSIQGFAELFRLGAHNEHIDQGVMMRRIEEESARMKTLVEDLLLLARLDETRTAERTSVDLAVLAADACSDAVAIDPSRDITLDAPEPVVVLGNADHLRQAVANLVANAIKHTRSGTAIDLSAHLRGDLAVLTVRDHGAGLAEDSLAHVFERFWQADAARTGSGAGLGLSIVDSIAKEHGGTARAANAPDGGAVFSIELPLNPDRPLEPGAPS
jgi:two-component system OmpR family sensor kinase